MEHSVVNGVINRYWYDITGLHLEPTALEDLSVHDELYIASVIFTGEEQGSFTIAMGEATARRIASNMFEYAVDDVSFDDIKDCMGEIANVLAGNLKIDLFCDSELSKPLVCQGSDSDLLVFKIDAIFQKKFIAENNEELLIQVCQSS